MYACRYYTMYIRAKDGLMTDNKASAKLFDSVEEAKEFIDDWKVTSKVDQTGVKVEIIEVETKVVMSRAGNVVAEV